MGLQDRLAMTAEVTGIDAGRARRGGRTSWIVAVRPSSTTDDSLETAMGKSPEQLNPRTKPPARGARSSTLGAEAALKDAPRRIAPGLA